ncbi:MAG: Gx transporter family protein [Acholeplasmataceae bacterium]|jgi:heptaprenyl diphosphate synthase|nr:Gx transporter family protein [Acholeplasmataceae bacterium]MDD4194195.1 Gx transporter family protein [Acholeplasmataceae bacterium]
MNIRKMTLLANLLAIAIVLNIIESAFPIIPVPGAKLGFANIVTLVVLYIYSFKDSSILTILRVLLVALLSGKLLGPVFYMSIAGAVTATLVMGIMKKTNFFGMIGVSVIGSIFHCIGQIVAGIFVIGSTAIIWYLPIMLFLSIPSGALTGIIAKRFVATWQTWHNEIS